MFMIELQHPYISVKYPGMASYGGGQQFSADPMLRRCGCGIIAATDLLLYLSCWHAFGAVDYFAGLLSEEVIPSPSYHACIQRMNRKYFPMIPYGGINGLMLMAGVQRFFHDHGMPYNARWCFLSDKLWKRMENMLRQDIPVILSVGPNFPVIWGDERVSLYRKTEDERYLPGPGAKSHFVTVTGMDAGWLRVSSWGRIYYLNRKEFEAYTHQHSLRFVSNILLVERK